MLTAGQKHSVCHSVRTSQRLSFRRKLARCLQQDKNASLQQSKNLKHNVCHSVRTSQCIVEMLTARQTVRKMLTAGQNAFYSKTKRMITTEQNAKIQRLSFRRNLTHSFAALRETLRSLQDDRQSGWTSWA